MQIVKSNPTYIRIKDASDDELDSLRQDLSYKDLSIQYNYLKAKKNVWMWRNQPNWPEYVESLKAKIKQCALFEDDDGFYTYSGLIHHIERLNYKFKFTDEVKTPKYRTLPYDVRYKPFSQYKHQREAVLALLQSNHAAIRLPTGAGKSRIVEDLIKTTGFTTLVMVPSVSIANQLYEQFVTAFGKKYVGRVGNGKKEFNKHIVVGIAASLTKIEEGTPIFKALSKKEMFITDEAHLIAANTFAKVAVGLVKDVPVRYSVSATPERNDGRDMLLEGLIGPIVYEKLYRELVVEGILAQLNFTIFNVESSASYVGSNSKKNSQEHCLYNKNIIAWAAKLANVIINHTEENVIIFVEEKEQLTYLKNAGLPSYTEFAHSGSDVVQQVKDFNAGKIRLMVGTSAVAVGTDFKTLKNLIFLMSGKSSTKIKQVLGRATRICPGKTSAKIYDFHVVNDKQSSRHFGERLGIYEVYSDDIQFKE